MTLDPFSHIELPVLAAAFYVLYQHVPSNLEPGKKNNVKSALDQTRHL